MPTSPSRATHQYKPMSVKADTPEALTRNLAKKLTALEGGWTQRLLAHRAGRAASVVAVRALRAEPAARAPGGL